MRLLRIEHKRQEVSTGCLAACAQMALAHLGITVAQAALNQCLGLTPAGVPTSHLSRLERYGVQVGFRRGLADDLRSILDQDIPPIVFVCTAPLSYWQVNTQHAVLVSGYDGDRFTINDPAFPGPYQVPSLTLMLAGDEFDNRYALVTQ
jgi:ABC-type bacteriocin/lantibiotic exporter with double-glycine peptidase domain